jgi:hypothetical protein
MLSAEYLKERYPLVYNKGIMCGSFAPDEWDGVILDLSERISKYLELNPNPQFAVDQIKEKYGGLRFYINCIDDEIEGYIREAELAVDEIERGLKLL